MSALNQKRLYDSLDAFSELTAVPVTLFTPEGVMQKEFNPDKKFCSFFEIWKSPSSCWKNLKFSIQASHEMGEPYIFTCPAGLTQIAVPVLSSREYIACAVAGPLAMGDPGNRLVKEAVELNPSAKTKLVQIALFISGMKVYTPMQIQKLSTLFYSAVMQGAGNSSDYDAQSERYKRELETAEQIIRQKKATQGRIDLPPTLDELEPLLLQELHAHHRKEARQCLDAMINELFMVEGGNLDSMKLRIVDLTMSIARSASNEGIPLKIIFGNDFNLLNAISHVDSLEKFPAWEDMMVDHYIDNVFQIQPAVSSTTADAISYIAAHYMDKLSLRELSQHLFISESRLSKLFRQELGTNFTDYLNQTRIDQSIKLMETTHLNLLEISFMVGFEDQSYFTKVFKRVQHETPRQYKAKCKGDIHD